MCPTVQLPYIKNLMAFVRRIAEVRLQNKMELIHRPRNLMYHYLEKSCSKIHVLATGAANMAQQSQA